MADGSTISAVKAALVTLLEARAGMTSVNVSNQAPVSALDVKNTSGAFDAVWLGDANDDTNIVVFGGLPLWFDESYEFDLIVQVLRPLSDGTQPVTDARAVAILGEVFGLLASNPTLSLTSFSRCEVTPSGWRHITGPLPGGVGFGSRFEVRLHVDARLTLT